MPRSRTIDFPLGNLRVRLSPHVIDGIGPRVIVEIDDGGKHELHNLSADDLRRFCQMGTIAAAEAEAMAARQKLKGAA